MPSRERNLSRRYNSAAQLADNAGMHSCRELMLGPNGRTLIHHHTTKHNTSPRSDERKMVSHWRSPHQRKDFSSVRSHVKQRRQAHYHHQAHLSLPYCHWAHTCLDFPVAIAFDLFRKYIERADLSLYSEELVIITAQQKSSDQTIVMCFQLQAITLYLCCVNPLVHLDLLLHADNFILQLKLGLNLGMRLFRRAHFTLMQAIDAFVFSILRGRVHWFAVEGITDPTPAES
eukprot:2474446-Pyramimonas_sp.AAC.1